MFCKYIIAGGPVNSVGKALSEGTDLVDLAILENAIRRLDGKKFCQLFIGEQFPDEDAMVPWGGTGMEISGGEEDRYYCQVASETEEDLDVFMIFDSALDDPKDFVEVRRGQYTSVWKGNIVNQEQMLKIATLFAETGEKSGEHEWIKSR